MNNNVYFTFLHLIYTDQYLNIKLISAISHELKSKIK